MLVSLKTKIIAILSAIGMAILAVWAYRSGKEKAERNAMDDALDGLEKVVKRSEEVSDQSAKAHNEAVDQANAALEEERVQEQTDRADVRNADVDGLLHGSDKVNAAIDRANGGV